MARHVEEDLAAVYRAVVRVSLSDNGQVTTRRFGAYNTKGVATSQAKKHAGAWGASGKNQTEWWVEKAETTWTRV